VLSWTRRSSRVNNISAYSGFDFNLHTHHVRCPLKLEGITRRPRMLMYDVGLYRYYYYIIYTCVYLFVLLYCQMCYYKCIIGVRHYSIVHCATVMPICHRLRGSIIDSASPALGRYIVI